MDKPSKKSSNRCSLIIEVFVSKRFGSWGELLFNLIKIPFVTIKNPKFVFPFLIIMIISSAGIWVPWAFDIDLSTVCNTSIDADYISKVAALKDTSIGDFKSAFLTSCNYVRYQEIVLFQSFSMFMFNVGILGGIAAEFVLVQRDSKNDSEENKTDSSIIKEYTAFFIWIVAFILSFYALKNPSQSSSYVNLSTWLSVSLWICTNYHKKEYTLPVSNNTEAFDGGDDVTEDDLNGPGLNSQLSDTQNDNTVEEYAKDEAHDQELNGKGL